MHGILNVAIAQAPGWLADPQSRIDWLKSTIDVLGDTVVDLLVLPELYLTGYNVGEQIQQWAEERGGFYSSQIAEMARLNQIAIHFGYAEKEGPHLYNSAACYDKTGVMIGHHRKLVLPPGYELDHFTAGKRYSQFQMGEFRIATLICYDAEFPETFRKVCALGCDLVVVPTALGAQWGVVAKHLIPTRAFENGVYVCYANHCGEENGLTYYGGSCVVGPDGKDLARALEAKDYLCVQLDLAAVGVARRRLPYHFDRLKLPGVAHVVG